MTSVLAILSPMCFLVMMNANISIQFNSQGMLRRIPLGFTCEKSVVDLLSVSVNSVAGDSPRVKEMRSRKARQPVFAK